jgi:hypothetical protein
VPPNSMATHLAPFGAKRAKSDHSASSKRGTREAALTWLG